MITNEKITNAVLDHFLEKATACNVSMLAERLSCSENTIRRRLATTGEVPEHCVPHRGATLNTSKGWRYTPSIDLVARRLRALRTAAENMVKAVQRPDLSGGAKDPIVQVAAATWSLQEELSA